MLAHLRVKNLGVLEDASIAPAPGFTVITGETGAGKTLLLDAIRLLTGGKARPGAVGPFGEEAVSEGLFDAGDTEIGVTRVVPREAKSRAYLDGTLVAAGTLAARLGDLVEVVGQHDHMLLRRSQAVLDMVDGSLDDEGRAALDRYAQAWIAYGTALEDQRRLGGDRMALERELDLVRYQSEEIAAAGLQSGDDERMESMAVRLRNSEAMREHLSLAMGALGSMSDSGGDLVSRLRKLADLDPSLDDHVAGAEAIVESTLDLARSLREVAEQSLEDPEALTRLESQLNTLGDLKRKYGKTLDEVLEFGSDAARRAGELEELLERAEGIEDEVRRRKEQLDESGSELSAARAKTAAVIVAHAQADLVALGLPSATLEVRMARVDPGPSGVDRIELLFASDRRLDPGPVQEVASGGELSRMVLALRLATRSKDVDTLIFDEVDAGVGGATALALGRKLLELSETTQVLCVTHLPQVAAHAHVQYTIERSGATASVRRLSDEERVTELSRMLAGMPESRRGREAAAELLEEARA